MLFVVKGCGRSRDCHRLGAYRMAVDAVAWRARQNVSSRLSRTPASSHPHPPTRQIDGTKSMEEVFGAIQTAIDGATKALVA